MDAVEALKCIDDRWYRIVAGKNSRWMDLIGDYAGNERFILDGESLLQNVLEDPLLALARADDPSFQILHAVHSMERLLDEMLRRSAIFDIVFWEDTRHLTLKGGTDYSVSSRLLARALLFSHLVEHSSEMGLEIFAFSSLKDPAWLAYQRRTKPMFVMLNDGGTRKDTDHDMAMRILIQRIFIFGLLTSGVAVTLLREAEFRDSKIFSFVVEGRFGLETPKSLPAALWYAAQDGETELGNKLRRQTSLVPLAPLRVTPPGLNELDLLIKDVLDYLVVRQIELPDLFWELTSIFFLHIMILPTLPVSERAHPVEDGDLLAMLVGTFLAKVNTIVASFILKSNRFVDIDGRVFTRILRYTISSRHSQTNTLTELVGRDISSRLETVWKSVNAPPPDFTKLSTYFPNHGDQGPSSTASDIPKTFTLLPFHNDIFDEELAVVHVEVSDEASSSSSPCLQFCKGTPFTDAKHWHANHRAILPKHLGGEGPGRKDVDERSRQRRLRREQRFMVNMQRLSSSLTGASGRELKPILITPTRRKVSEIIDDTSTRNPRRDEKVHVNQQKKGKPVISARERIRQKNAQEKKVKEDSSSQAWWQGQLHQLQMITTYEKKMSHFRSLLRNPKAASGWLSIEVRLYHLHLTIQQWVDEHDPEDAEIHDHYTVSIMRTVKELYTSDFLTKTTLCILATILISLGFGAYIPPLEDDASHKLQPDRVMEFSFIKLLKSKSHKPIHKFMAIKEDPVVWQLRVFGEYMDRSMDSAPDPRVSFEPDAWQRDVLDGLDEPKTSLLVVAPTSAGKTFISFYAMEKVLRESDDGVLVYVAPTKALVNQVAAEVHARFRKEVDGQTCWSIHTRDYRVHDFQKCQILVTVPEMLGIILLSPPLARTFTPRIRRIILDEIHTIGQDEGGTVWEQIILLAPCPIIGLSATIGAPEKFNTWLETVQKAKGFDHKFIHHPHRYSHLRKFAYFPQLLDKDKPFLGLDGGRSSTEMMRFIHPVSTLSFAGTIPPDLSLESSDLLRLYKVLLSQNIAGVEQLDPTIVFSRDTFIRQKDVLRYEAEIKNNVLAQLIAAPDALDSPSLLQKVVQEIQDPVLKETPKSRLNTPPGSSIFLSGLTSGKAESPSLPKFIQPMKVDIILSNPRKST